MGEPFIVRRVLLRLLRGVPAPAAGAATPPASAGEPVLRDTDAMDTVGLQAFIDQVRWVIAAHDKRSELFGQRAATVLGFDGVIMSVLVAGFALIKNDVEFTCPFLVNAVAVVVLPVVSAVVCLGALWPRKITIPESSRLRDYWTTFQQPESKMRPQAQIAHEFLGGAKDPVKSAREEAASRGKAYKVALLLLTAAVVALAALTGQVLTQQA